MSAPYTNRTWEKPRPILISEVSDLQRAVIRAEIAHPFEKARKKRLAAKKRHRFYKFLQKDTKFAKIRA